MEGNREVPSADQYIDAVFGETGYLAQMFEGYSPRPGQVAFARAVDRAINGRGHLLAEAGTGTGKSVAYSVPASYFAAKTGKPIVIVTANIALQEQIVGKDLPLLQKILPWKFTFALLKGKNNFLCVDRFLSDGAQFKTPESSEERRQLPVIQEWARESMRGGVENETGDVSDLPFEPMGLLWRRFSVGSDDCKGSRCRYRHECFALAAAEQAKQASIIVTNYHMLFAHLQVYLQSGMDLVLSAAEAYILDEAHKAPDIARDFFGFHFTEGSVRASARRLDKLLKAGDTSRAIEFSARSFFGAMHSLKKDEKRYKSRLTREYEPHETAAWETLKKELSRGTELTGKRQAELELEIQGYPSLDDKREELVDELGDVEKLHDRMIEITRGIRSAMEKPTEEDKANDRHVFYLEENSDRQQVSICSKLVESSDALRPGLFMKRVGKQDPVTRQPIEGGPVAVICSSATLATDAKNFDYIANELGCPRTAETLVADSPFNWPEQCLFIAPSTMPEPNDPSFRDEVARHVERVIHLAGGRTLALFTSKRVLEHTYDAIFGSCHRQGIRVLRQGDAPRTKLIADFKSDTKSVLLGLESFWAGVDVPGEACSVVVIDRLPFPSPDDPVLDVLQSRNEKVFWTHSIPRSIIQFKQGFGRGVRSMSCRCVVVCLDQRIVKKRYGKQFLRALPPVPKTTRLEAIAEWLNPPPALAWDAE